MQNSDNSPEKSQYQFSDKKDEIANKLYGKASDYIKFEQANVWGTIVVIIGIAVFLVWSSINENNYYPKKDLIILSEIANIKSNNELITKDNLVGLMAIQRGYLENIGLSNSIYSWLFKAFIVTIGFFLIRLLLSFQSYNTKRADKTRCIAMALDLYDGEGDFNRLVEILMSEPYRTIKEYPDSKLKEFLRNIK